MNTRQFKNALKENGIKFEEFQKEMKIYYKGKPRNAMEKFAKETYVGGLVDKIAFKKVPAIKILLNGKTYRLKNAVRKCYQGKWINTIELRPNLETVLGNILCDANKEAEHGLKMKRGA